MQKKTKISKDKTNIILQRGEELLKWKSENAVQKRFFSLPENEQRLLEKTYIIFAQVCPNLAWKDYLNRLSKSDKFDTTTKNVLKKVTWI